MSDIVKIVICIVGLLSITACNQSSDNAGVDAVGTKAEMNDLDSNKSTQQAVEASSSSLAKKPLNLDLVPGPSGSSDETLDFSDQHALPDLFEKQEKDKRVSVGAKPLRDEANKDYLDSVQGAEFKVEIKTN